MDQLAWRDRINLADASISGARPLHGSSQRLRWVPGWGCRDDVRQDCRAEVACEMRCQQGSMQGLQVARSSSESPWERDWWKLAAWCSNYDPDQLRDPHARGIDERWSLVQALRSRSTPRRRNCCHLCWNHDQLRDRRIPCTFMARLRERALVGRLDSRDDGWVWGRWATDDVCDSDPSESRTRVTVERWCVTLIPRWRPRTRRVL